MFNAQCSMLKLSIQHWTFPPSFSFRMALQTQRTRSLFVVSHVARDAERIGAEWRGPHTALRTVGFAPGAASLTTNPTHGPCL